MGDQDPVILTSYGCHKGGVNSLHFRPHMKHVVSGGADSVVLLWSLHCRPNLRHPVVRPYRFLGHQVIILPQRAIFIVFDRCSCWSQYRVSCFCKNKLQNIFRICPVGGLGDMVSAFEDLKFGCTVPCVLSVLFRNVALLSLSRLYVL